MWSPEGIIGGGWRGFGIRESKYLSYSTPEERDKDWGRHCEWPPQWVRLPSDLKEKEQEEIYQRAFQQKVGEALCELYGVETEGMPLEKLMELSREHPFWIWWDGEPRLPRRLWELD